MKKKIFAIVMAIFISAAPLCVVCHAADSILNVLPDYGLSPSYSDNPLSLQPDDWILFLPEKHILSSNSYIQMEKQLLHHNLPTIFKYYEACQTLMQKDTAPLSLTSVSVELTPASRVLFGLFSPFDTSWLNTLHIYTLSSISDGFETSLRDIYANEHKLFSSEYYFDIPAQTEYSRIPEVSSYFLKTDYLELYSAYGYNYSVNKNEGSFENPWPENTVLQEVLEYYSSLFLKYCSQVTSNYETLSVENIENTCRTLTAHFTPKETEAMIFEFLYTLRDDPKIRQFLTVFADNSLDAEYYYESFQYTLDVLLEHLHSEEAPEIDFSLSSKIWLNPHNESVGRQFCIHRDEKSIPLFTLFCPYEGQNLGLLAKLGNDDFSYGIQGTLDCCGGELNGSLLCMINDAPYMSTNIEHFTYDMTYPSDDMMKGSLFIDMHSGNEEVPLYNPYANYDFYADFSGTFQKPMLKLSIQSALVPLANITLQKAEASPEILPTLPDFSGALDTSSQQDMITFSKEADWSFLIQNCVEAGIPSKAIEQISFYVEQLLFYGQSIL